MLETLRWLSAGSQDSSRSTMRFAHKSQSEEGMQQLAFVPLISTSHFEQAFIKNASWHTNSWGLILKRLNRKSEAKCFQNTSLAKKLLTEDDEKLSDGFACGSVSKAGLQHKRAQAQGLAYEWRP